MSTIGIGFTLPFHPKTRRYVTVPHNCTAAVIELSPPFEHNAVVFTGNDATFRSVSLTQTGGAPKAAHRGSWPHAVLYIDTMCYDFENVPALRTRISNAYPGAEGIVPHVVQMGRRRDQHQKQLVVLEMGKPVYVADQHARYVAYTWDGEMVKPTTPTMRNMCDFIIAYARANCHTHPRLLWAKKNLENMGMASSWPADLAQRMSDADRT